ncbi:MAG: hypothetical protein NDJ75_11705 [Thermoanaerobaculia bacterium]|nr:hypothetical protein [Thermoanaerobaculia bacterium]
MPRLMLIVVDSAVRDEVEVLLRKAGAPGFTELAAAAGLGETGLRLGSGAFPETSAVLMTVLDPSAEQSVRVALAGFEEGGGSRVRAYAWGVDEVA